MRDETRTAVVHELWPLLGVHDLQRSLAFYRGQLGFALVADDGRPEGEVRWCRLERGGSSIMLQQFDLDGDEGAAGDPRAARGRGVCFYFVCDDADAMHAELSARGLRLPPPSVAYYGMKQLYVPEPDGYAICFESPV